MGFADAFWVPISTGMSPFHSKLDKFRFPLHVGEVRGRAICRRTAHRPFCSALQKERLILVAAHQSWIRPNTLQTLHCCTADFAGDPGWKERHTIHNGGRRSINPGGRSALHRQWEKSFASWKWARLNFNYLSQLEQNPRKNDPLKKS